MAAAPYSKPLYFPKNGGRKFPFIRDNYTEKRAGLVVEFGSRCRLCDSTRRLEFAHVRRTPLSGKANRLPMGRLRDIERHRDCYRLLCHRCHRAFDGCELTDAEEKKIYA